MRVSTLCGSPLLFLLAAFFLLTTAPVFGLKVFRIGGADAPPPALEGPYEFVQLEWGDFEAARHGSSELLELDGAIRPQQLDPDVNLTPIISDLGGQVLNLVWIGWGPPQEDDFFVFDEDPDTIYLGDGHFAAHGPRSKSLTFDFGARLLLDRIRFYPREKHLQDRFVESFRIGISDGDPLKEGTREYVVGQRGSNLDFDIVHEFSENTDAVIDLELPAVPIRRLLFEADENTRGIWEVAELEIYGSGFVPFAGYTSNVIDLGAPASLGDLVWVGEREEGASVELSMRSGQDDDPNTYWRSTFRGGERTRFDSRGRPLNLASYNKLQLGEKAGISPDTENWSFWSSGYDFDAGQGEMVGDGPQQYVQFRANLNSTKEASGRLDYLQFAVSIPPVASQALGEITPQTAAPGQVTPFTYKVRPILAPDDLGFDSIVIDTPTPAAGVDAVRISGQDVAFEVMDMGLTSFEVKLPRIDAQRTEELIEVDFRAEVFKFGTVFSGRVFDSQRPEEVPQSISAGDADALDDSNRLSVDLTAFGARTIRQLAISPSAFSPNGDGINDAVSLEYDLLNLSGSVPVRAEVFDLSGRLLGTVVDATAASGRFTAQWDGRDGSGKLLPPGLYVVRLSVQADKGEDSRQAVVSLVY